MNSLREEYFNFFRWSLQSIFSHVLLMSKIIYYIALIAAISIFINIVLLCNVDYRITFSAFVFAIVVFIYITFIYCPASKIQYNVDMIHPAAL